MEIYLGLGANQGNRLANLRGAIARLGELGTVLATSPLYASAPMYVHDQPEFLNLVVLLRTEREPQDVLAAVKAIEAALGRDLSPAAQRYGPRSIDIDLLLALQRNSPQTEADHILIQTPDLVIPHPRLAERAFVLLPLRDLAPELAHPLLGQTISALAKAVADQEIRKSVLSIGWPLPQYSLPLHRPSAAKRRPRHRQPIR